MNYQIERFQQTYSFTLENGQPKNSKHYKFKSEKVNIEKKIFKINSNMYQKN